VPCGAAAASEAVAFQEALQRGRAEDPALGGERPLQRTDGEVRPFLQKVENPLPLRLPVSADRFLPTRRLPNIRPGNPIRKLGVP